VEGKCEWIRAFDGHFNIGCANETGQRANGDFKRDSIYRRAKWEFNFCPYCGREIKLVSMAEQDKDLSTENEAREMEGTND
jgi:hypothetical protein